jgi:hypothetical protein
MSIRIEQLIALDQALAVGCTVTHKGTCYTVTPLTLGDWAEVLAWRKSTELAAYLAGAVGTKIDKGVRFQDMHDILHRCARYDDYVPSDPAGAIEITWRSLRHADPTITKHTVSELLSDVDFHNVLIEVLGIKNFGPLEIPEEGDDAAPFVMSWIVGSIMKSLFASFKVSQACHGLTSEEPQSPKPGCSCDTTSDKPKSPADDKVT